MYFPIPWSALVENRLTLWAPNALSPGVSSGRPNDGHFQRIIGGSMGVACSLFALLVLLLATMSGCTGQAHKSNDAPPEDYPTLQGRFAEDPVQEPLVALEAFVGDRKFFVQYESSDGPVYAGGDWSNRIDLRELEQGSGDTYSGPYILPLDYQQLIIRRRAIDLLVAVENRGTSTERDVTVRARLSTPEDPELLLAQGAIIASIAPGEIQVVRFGQLGRLLQTFNGPKADKTHAIGPWLPKRMVLRDRQLSLCRASHSIEQVASNGREGGSAACGCQCKPWPASPRL